MNTYRQARRPEVEKVVVVGAGMVGHRFVDELVRADREQHFSVELIGEEEYEPYNRILLSDVLAGRADLKAIGLPLPDPSRVQFWRGVDAVRRSPVWRHSRATCTCCARSTTAATWRLGRSTPSTPWCSAVVSLAWRRRAACAVVASR